MRSRNIRSGMLALLVAWLMPGVVAAGITITPAAPTTNDNVRILVTWDVPGPCYTNTYTHSVVGNRILIQITTIPPPRSSGGVCVLVVGNSISVSVGALPAGHYTVDVYNQLNFSFQYSTTSFDVVTSDAVVVPLEGQAVHLSVKPLPPSNYAVELWTSWMMPNSCFTSSGTTSVTGNTIRADVTLVATGMACAALPASFDFRSSSLGQLPPGKYNVATYFNGVPGDRRDLTIMPDVTPANPMLSVTPIVPSSADDVSLVVSATLPSSCYETASYQTVVGNEIRLDLTLVGTHAGCVDQPLSQSAQYFLGKMAPGTYVVRMYYNGVLGLTQDLVIKSNADLALSQTVTPNPVERTGLVLHSIDVVNSGPDVASGVVVRTFLPLNLTYAARSSSQGHCWRFIGREIRCTLGSLSSGATAKIGILTRARIAGVATLSATVTTDAVDANTVNNTTTTDLLIQ